MSKKKKDKLLLNLVEGQKHRHRVAMVTEEGAWNQHEPNSGMARMFVIMLLIHVVVIGGIIIYDFINGDEAAPPETVVQTAAATPSALPPSGVSTETLDKALPIEDFDTYEWKSGDSLPLVAQKLRVSEEELIKLNLLDKGAQLDQNTILRVPKRGVVKALGLNVAGANGVPPQVAAVVQPPGLAEDPPVAPAAMNLTAPGEHTLAASSTLGSDAQPESVLQPQSLLTTPTESAPRSAEATSEAPKVAAEPPPAPAPEAVKAQPVPRSETPKPAAESRVAENTASKKPAPAPTPKAKGTSHLVKPGETLYRISSTYGVSIAALQKANNITKPELLRDGMKLVIPAK